MVFRKKWFSEKLRKNFDLENFRSDSFSIRTSRIESSRFRARVAKGGLPSEIALPGEAKSPKLCIEGWVRTLKSKKIFSANNEQGSIKRGMWIQSGFQKSFENFLLRIFSVRLILDTYLPYQELPLPSSCCKEEACLRITR